MSKRTLRYTIIAFLATAAVIASGAGNRQQYPEPVSVPVPLEAVFTLDSYKTLRDSAANRITDEERILEQVVLKLLALREGSEETVSILHIGDSHVQAGYFTGRLRELFQEDFGNAGRGFIAPYKLAGMNEPRDYSIAVPYSYKSARITQKDPGPGQGFNGVSVRFETPAQQFRIWSKTKFNGITVFHGEKAPLLFAPENLDTDMYCILDNGPHSSRIVLSEPVDSLLLKGYTGEGFDDPTFHGFSLDNGMPGVLYHEAGVNGAAFEHYMNQTTLLSGGAAALSPDLIIISLGTNNCYGGNFRREQLYGVVDRFLKKIKEAYPSSAILVTTPIESCNRRNRAYHPNKNIPEAASVIAEAAAENGIACWDLYSAAGGAGSNARWFKEKLFNTDHIHLTVPGYRLQAEMLYEAFANYYNALIF